MAGLKHVWLTNTAFTRLTGIKRVCVTCKQTNETAEKVCPGKPPEKEPPSP